MERQDVAQVLRDFMVSRIPDEEIDYIEAAYLRHDVEQLTLMAEVVAKDHGLSLAEVLAQAA